MNKTTVFKFFWHDQDQEQEQWLSEMARRGLHLASVDMVCRWTFIKDSPADVVYRVDYSDKRRDSPYHDQIAAAGWECAADVTGWFYWRRPAMEGVSLQLFSDLEMRIAGQKRKFSTLALAIIPFTLLAMTSWQSRPFPFVVAGFLLLTMPLYAYIVVRLVRRIAAMRQSRI